jgi:hypothetical protein
MHSTYAWPQTIPNGPLDLYSLAIKTKLDSYDQVIHLKWCLHKRENNKYLLLLLVMAI